MSRQTPIRFALRTTLLSAAAVALCVSAGAEARADGVRVGASVRIGPGGTYYRPAHRVYRPVRARRFVASGSLWAGNLFIGFAEPPPPAPPPPCPQSCEPPPEPAYQEPYQEPYQAQPVMVRQPLIRLRPRLAIGAFMGGIDVEDREAGEAYGLLGRFYLGRYLGLEAELSRDEIENDVRIDNRVGGAILFNILPHHRLNPYLLAGGGALFTDVADGAYESQAGYAEAGVGLELKLGRKLSLTLEGRSGVRRRSGAEPSEVPLRYIAPPADREEAYTRGRIGALLYF